MVYFIIYMKGFNRILRFSVEALYGINFETKEKYVNLYNVEKMGKGNSYIAPDAHFISSVLLFSSSLPWLKFEKFFKTKKLLSISAAEQLTLLRLIALQEILCIDDAALLQWTKSQLYLFNFMQSDFKARLPSENLLKEFRTKFDEVGLLKPFRKQCQRLIQEQNSRFPKVSVASEASPSSTSSVKYGAYKVSDIKVDLLNLENSTEASCPNCGSFNIIKLAPSQVTSSLPDIRFSRCRFCGNTFRDNKNTSV